MKKCWPRVRLFGRTFWSWSDVRVDIKRFFFTFLEVNMSNILWSMRICKRTFFPVCKMCGYVNTLVYFYLAPYSDQIVGLRECWLSNLSDICRTFWVEYVGPECLIVDTLGVVFAFITTRLHDPSMTRMLFSYPNISGYLIITLFFSNQF
jgi:hypothetical protein